MACPSDRCHWRAPTLHTLHKLAMHIRPKIDRTYQRMHLTVVYCMDDDSEIIMKRVDRINLSVQFASKNGSSSYHRLYEP